MDGEGGLVLGLASETFRCKLNDRSLPENLLLRKSSRILSLTFSVDLLSLPWFMRSGGLGLLAGLPSGFSLVGELEPAFMSMLFIMR